MALLALPRALSPEGSRAAMSRETVDSERTSLLPLNIQGLGRGGKDGRKILTGQCWEEGEKEREIIPEPRP